MDIFSATQEVDKEYGFSLMICSNQKRVDQYEKEITHFKKAALRTLELRGAGIPKIKRPMKDGAEFVKNLIRDIHFHALLPID